MAPITHRKRVLAAVAHQETDRVPIDFGGILATTIVPSTYEKLKRYLDETHTTRMGWKRQQLVLPDETILRRMTWTPALSNWGTTIRAGAGAMCSQRYTTFRSRFPRKILWLCLRPAFRFEIEQPIAKQAQ